MDYSLYLSPSMLKTAFFTGHRKLTSSEIEHLTALLPGCISDAYAHGYRTFLCGGALGFDTLAAKEILKMKNKLPDIRLSLAIPCPSQPDFWPVNDQIIYRDIVNQADEVKILSQVYYQGVMHSRNRYMVEKSSLCICYLNNMRGGTAYTVRYALQYPYMNFINLAVYTSNRTDIMRESKWNCTYIFPSVFKNAGIVRLFHLSEKNHALKNTRKSFYLKQDSDSPK